MVGVQELHRGGEERDGLADSAGRRDVPHAPVELRVQPAGSTVQTKVPFREGNRLQRARSHDHGTVVVGPTRTALHFSHIEVTRLKIGVRIYFSPNHVLDIFPCNSIQDFDKAL